MNPDEVYVRTDKGQSELRKADLPPGERVVYFMTDGSATIAEILAQLAGLGVTEETFERLRTLGFITPRAAPQATPSGTHAAVKAPEAMTAPQRVFAARQFLNETAVDAVGLRSYFFTLKLERSYSLSDLRLLLPDYTKMIEKGHRKLEADLLIRRARELTAER
jgi:predicted secreted protein